MAIEAITVAMMDTGSSQMRDPPHGHKQRKQEPIEPLPILNQAVFQVPAAAFVILKRGLHAHAPPILAHATASSSLPSTDGTYVPCTRAADNGISDLDTASPRVSLPSLDPRSAYSPSVPDGG